MQLENTDGAVSIGEVVEEWLTELRAIRGLSHRTVIGYRDRMGRWTEALVHLGELDAQHVKKTLFTMTDSAPSTNVLRLSALQQFVKWCDKQGYFADLRILKIPRPKVPKRIPGVWTVEEVFRILDAAAELAESGNIIDTRNHLFVTLLYGTGMRLSEALGLRLVDLDFDDQIVTVTGKGSKQRKIPLVPQIEPLVREWMRLRTAIDVKPEAEEYVFVGSQGRRLNRTAVAHTILNPLIEQAGVPHGSAHTFRHSYATHLLDAGADLRIIQEILGHENLTTTEKYTHVSTERLTSTINQFHPRSEIKEAA